VILADTSVWIDHLRAPSPTFIGLLRLRLIAIHPYATLEIALVSIARRDETLRAMDELLPMPIATVDDIRALAERRRLDGLGIGFDDTALIASCLLRAPSSLWTRDRRLQAAAEHCGVRCFSPATVP